MLEPKSLLYKLALGSLAGSWSSEHEDDMGFAMARHSSLQLHYTYEGRLNNSKMGG
jgi:hypothetical protein